MPAYVETVFATGQRKRICAECKKEFWCYPGQHEWSLPPKEGKTVDRYITKMTADWRTDPSHMILYCSYHCMRAEEKRRQAVLKEAYDKLLWEAENLYDANGNRIARKPYTKKAKKDVA